MSQYKTLKQSLTKFLTSGKRFILSVPYYKIFKLIIEVVIIISILINIYLLMDAVNNFDLLKYSTSLVWLFVLGYVFIKKPNN